MPCGCDENIVKNGGISKREALLYEWNTSNLKKDCIYKSKALPFAWAGKIIKKMGALTNAKLCNADEMKIL